MACCVAGSRFSYRICPVNADSQRQPVGPCARGYALQKTRTSEGRRVTCVRGDAPSIGQKLGKLTRLFAPINFQKIGKDGKALPIFSGDIILERRILQVCCPDRCIAWNDRKFSILLLPLPTLMGLSYFSVFSDEQLPIWMRLWVSL